MGELVKQDYFTELDRRDQEQVIQEAIGESSKELFYDVNGKKGLSYEGVNTVAFLMGDVETEAWFQRDRIDLNGEVYWSTTVRAINNTFNLKALGTAEVPEMMDVYDLDANKKRIPDGHGGFTMHKEFDRFCLRKSMSMAQRNAKRAVMPTPMLAKWLQFFMARAAGQKTEMPFAPKNVEASYKVLGGGEQEKKEPAKKTQPPKREILKIIEDTIRYNIKIADPKYEGTIDVEDQGTEFLIAPMQGIALTEEDHYKIDGALQGFNAQWKERFWIIPKVTK